MPNLCATVEITDLIPPGHMRQLASHRLHRAKHRIGFCFLTFSAASSAAETTLYFCHPERALAQDPATLITGPSRTVGSQLTSVICRCSPVPHVPAITSTALSLSQNGVEFLERSSSMKRLLALLVLLSLVLAGCSGTVFVGGAINNGPIVVASGVVSIVRLTFASNGNGTSVTVTVVTLLQTSAAQTLTFCGSQVGQFPMNTFVTTQFTAGTTCSTLVTVTKG
jgi:hypothetical protein